jgi:hypothetical protein
MPRRVLQMRPPCRVVEPGDTSPWRMGLPMDLEPGNATGSVPKSMVRETPEESGPVRASGAMMFVLAAWIGLVAGFLDLGVLVVNKRLIKADFYRLGGDFVWIIPAGVTILVLVPAIMLVLRRSAVVPGPSIGRRPPCLPRPTAPGTCC